jgi:uncharacterized membrane protein
MDNLHNFWVENIHKGCPKCGCENKDTQTRRVRAFPLLVIIFCIVPFVFFGKDEHKYTCQACKNTYEDIDEMIKKAKRFFISEIIFGLILFMGGVFAAIGDGELASLLIFGIFYVPFFVLAINEQVLLSKYKKTKDLIIAAHANPDPAH